ncbi:hypothetical protein CCR94_08905 [Rhodoblastus sphagnicola]|uniref:Uncharacterized protein n=1 Tax=Rhodoblastus sphagnicola TaxID=333368 RepID=A0A2S6N9X1_9HYPH|nr:hypothetical protein [Rhodoblastus sphagnicola]MBB4198782.1 hypothetical protein [Rhodoblastus sphagnicola]PPQ31415.1 hypothetical protein CCR94_08905 [Rhodoblastus sphagnicola]
MLDTTELVKRKKAINMGVVFADANVFLAHFEPWLEITAFISALRAGEATPPADGVTPALTPQQLKSGGVGAVATDAIFAFCMAAALKSDRAAVTTARNGLAAKYGEDFPGAPAFWSFTSPIAEAVSLEDHVGQAAQKLLDAVPTPPPLRAKENWATALRFLEKARGSNFAQEIIHPLALWTRARWKETLEKGVAFLAHIEDNVPVLREVLAEPRNDEPFVAAVLLKMAPAIEQDLSDEASGFLRSLARR